jgi:two-component system phosphate regulon response regulator PhoB
MNKALCVLLVEDDPAIRSLLALHLRQAGFVVLEAEDGRNALRWLDEVIPDVLIIDWMLPDLSGISLIERLRRNSRTRQVPIVMVTARAAESDKVHGLEIGADDYVTKPFSPRELLARVRAVLRRRLPEMGDQPIAYGGLRYDPMLRQIQRDGRCATLGPTEGRLLAFLLAHPERVWTRPQLLDRVWGNSSEVEERTVDVHVRRLRLALRQIGADHLVETVRGAGYRLTDQGGGSAAG